MQSIHYYFCKFATVKQRMYAAFCKKYPTLQFVDNSALQHINIVQFILSVHCLKLVGFIILCKDSLFLAEEFLFLHFGWYLQIHVPPNIKMRIATAGSRYGKRGFKMSFPTVVTTSPTESITVFGTTPRPFFILSMNSEGVTSLIEKFMDMFDGCHFLRVMLI